MVEPVKKRAGGRAASSQSKVPKPDEKTQVAAREKLRYSVYDRSFFNACRQRALTWFEATKPDSALLSAEIVQHVLKSMSKNVALHIIRTWSFAWVTSARFHDANLLPCAMGCPGAKGSHSHYFRRPAVWQPVAAFCGHPVPPGVTYEAAVSSNSGDAHNVALVTNAFHTARRNPAWRRNVENLKFDDIKALGKAFDCEQK